MTYRADVAASRDVVARWCALAEQRLEYLTELFETGRWRRYHSEVAFLENIQEAKAAVEIWRDLVTREAARDNSAVDMSWIGRPRTVPPPTDIFSGQVHRPRPQPAPLPAKPLPRDVSIAVKTAQVSSDEAPSAPYFDAPAMHPAIDPILDPAVERAVERALDRALDPIMDRLTQDFAAIAERYPLLRNVM
jgi:uncharacterized repeat protein (TIGR03809 family)